MINKISELPKILNYKGNELFINNFSCKKIAREFGTPIFCYSISQVEKNFIELKNSFKGISPLICYAVKANFNKNIIKLLAKNGAGADVVSLGELKHCLENGMDSNKIVFSGVGKTNEELEYAIRKNIKQINIESEEELDDIIKICKVNKLKKKVKISIRVNPDVDAETHEKISTGRSEDKFGVPIKKVRSIFEKYKNEKKIEFVGISIHIGSQIQKIGPFKKAFVKVRKEIISLIDSGHKISTVDLGGGIGIDYGEDKIFQIKEYSDLIERLFFDLKIEVILEPGRYLVGSAGVIISKIIRIKKRENKNFLIIDCGMNNLIRPSLYNSIHRIIPSKKLVKGGIEKFDIVGPICETSDIFVKDLKLPKKIKKNDLLIICSTGAYGSCMSSNYNLRGEAKEVFVKKNKVVTNI